MIARERNDGFVYWAGRYHAPGGWLSLDAAGEFDAAALQQPLRLTVWAEGFGSTTVDVPGLQQDSTVEVALSRGELATLDGRVLEAGEPREGVLVTLHPRTLQVWASGEEPAVVATRSDADGVVKLRAPAGAYLARVRLDERCYVEALELPRADPWTVDLAGLASLAVDVMGDTGGPLVGARVFLADAQGRSEERTTDAQGRVDFRSLRAGEYQLGVPRGRGEATHAGHREALHLGVGVQHEVVVHLRPSSGPAYAYLVLKPAASTRGWVVRGREEGWLDVEPDGRIPIDLRARGTQRFELASERDAAGQGHGPRWFYNVPPQARDGHVVELRLDTDLRYAGELRSLTGRPLAGVRVFAHPLEETGDELRAYPSCVSDADGAFELLCGRARPHRLWFQGVAGSGAFGRTCFEAHRPPSALPTPLDITLAVRSGAGYEGLGSRRLEGRVSDAKSGLPIAEAWLRWVVQLPAADGVLHLEHPSFVTTTDADGDWSLELPDVPSLRVVIGASGRTEVERVLEARSGDERFDFALP